MNIETITSSQNATLKLIEKLNVGRKRRQLALIKVEGEREIQQAIVAGLEPQALLFREHANDAVAEVMSYFANRGGKIYQVASGLFSKLVMRESTSPAVAIFVEPTKALEIPSLGARTLVLEGIEKPGNLGAILRTVDGLGIDHVLLVDCLTDPYAPQAIRNSLGACFSVHWTVTNVENALKACQRDGVQIFAADPLGEKPIWQAVFPEKTALVFGSEAHGLTDHWHKAGAVMVQIPMAGKVDSLNVAVATTIGCYELLRQHSENQESPS